MPKSRLKKPARKPLLTMKEASQLLAVHPNTLRRWNHLGLIKTIRVGPRCTRRFKRKDLLALLRE